MTGPEHVCEAERLAREALAYEGLPSNHHIQLGQVAQVHAMLALTDATWGERVTITTRENLHRILPVEDTDA